MAHKKGITQEKLVDEKKLKQKLWTYSRDLMAVDDLSKCIVLDPFIGFSCHKADKNSLLDDDIRSKIGEKFKQYSPLNIENTCKLQMELLDVAKSYRLLYKFNIQYLSWLELMIKSYFKVMSIESPVNIEECNRYQGDNYKGVKVSAKKMIEKGTTMHILTGYLKNVDKKTCQFLESQNLDFSIMKSNMRNVDVIMLGPAALLNHDCNPNCEYLSSTKESIKIKTIENIQAGEELLCYYGNNFFGLNNEECACVSCEQNRIGYYKRVNENLEYTQSLNSPDVGTNKDISNWNPIGTEMIFSQTDTFEKCLILGVNSNPVWHDVPIMKDIFSTNLMKLNVLYYFLDQCLKFGDKTLHIADILNDHLDIIITVDIPSLIRQIMSGSALSSNTDCYGNCMRTPELPELIGDDHGTCRFLGFSSYKKLESKLDKAFVKLSLIEPIDNWKINKKKHVCMESEEKLKDLPFTRPKIGYLFCIYCDEFKTQPPRHLVLKHSNKAFVKNFLINEDNELNKNAALNFVRNQGFDHYNELTGKIIPVYCVRKDSQKEVIKVQCSNCFAHFSEETFQRHLKQCKKFNIIEMKNKGLL